MQIFPSFNEFKKLYSKGGLQLVWKVLPADLKTPVAAMLQLMADSSYHFLLESVEGGANRGRYSIIGLDPDLVFTCRDGKAEINKHADIHPHDFTSEKGKVFDVLRKVIKESQFTIPDKLPPMASGLFGYMSYDMVRLMEEIGNTNKPDNINIPDSTFIRPQVLVIFDSVKDEIYITVLVKPGAEKNAEVAFEAAKKKIATIVEKLSRSAKTNYEGFEKETKEDFEWKGFEAAYKENVSKAKEYILAGDIFQVVLSERYSRKFEYNAFSLYRALRNLNPSPYLFFLEFNDFSLVGSSPEILVKVKDGTVTIRPIAGTRPRGKNAEEDLALEKDLLEDQKEIAEHLMLLDLGRNDVGRVAEIGTVQVTEKMTIERYSHVMHIVSNVEGKLKKDVDNISALIAGFPAGTVSGAPKIRAMQIIEELESKKRSFYGGCIGYFSANGSMDTCIALRTALVKDKTLHIQAGAGIVADSDPDSECKEIYNKARSLMVAANSAIKYN